MPAILTLTTDFGLKDHFVAVMKGVILNLCPTAQIIDVSHEVTPFQPMEASFVIADAYRWFPKKSVHVVVVDPGVGSHRRPIVVEADGHFFIGPDNGVFHQILSKHKHKVRHLTNKKLTLTKISQTFQGRDVFAPAAAHLAGGTAFTKVGPLIKDYVQIDAPRGAVVLRVDRFGNLITNIEPPTTRFRLQIGKHTLTKIIHCYDDLRHGELGIIVGSSGALEIVANQASAAEITDCGRGSTIRVVIF